MRVTKLLECNENGSVHVSDGVEVTHAWYGHPDYRWVAKEGKGVDITDKETALLTGADFSATS